MLFAEEGRDIKILAFVYVGRFALETPARAAVERELALVAGLFFQYSRFRSSIGWVIRLWRDCCIRKTLFMHSTALLARVVSPSTADTRS